MARNSNSNSTRNPSGRLSMAAENYLLSIFRMDERGERVNLTSLSEHLKTLPDDEGMGTALPSVGGMVRRLSREGLVETDASKEVRLTARGRRASESVVRRHRLAERLVVDILGLDLRLAHIEAHRLEHAISPVLEKQIDEALGHPTTCPFGHPIPGSNYSSNRKSFMLDQASEGDELVIDSIPEDDPELLGYFVESRLVPGRDITVGESARTRGVITLKCDDDDVVFGYEVAAKIRVFPKAAA